MKICFVSLGSCGKTGGLYSYIRWLSKGLIDRGHSVSGIARFHEMSPKTMDYSLTDKLGEITTGPIQTHIIGPKPSYSPLLKQLQKLRDRPATRNLAIKIFNDAYTPSLSAAMPNDVDVVHYVTAGLEMLGFTALQEARKRGAAFTVHPAVHPGIWGDSPLDVFFYNQTDGIMAQSTYEKNHLVSLGVDESLIQVIELGPSDDGNGNGARFRAKYSIAADRPLILFIARKLHYKGYHDICRAMPKVLSAFPDACLVTVSPAGEPPYPEFPETALIDLGAASEEDKSDALAACNMFCMPSREESFGIVYIEAWLYGKPIIGGPAPAVLELIDDGVTGLHVDQDPEKIAAAIIKLLDNPSLSRQMGEAGRKVQQKRFTWEVVVREQERRFQEAIERRKKLRH